MRQTENLFAPAFFDTVRLKRSFTPYAGLFPIGGPKRRRHGGDAITGGVGVSAEQVAANVANLASSLTPIIATALATALSQTLAAVLPAVITSAGIPTQTQPAATA